MTKMIQRYNWVEMRADVIKINTNELELSVCKVLTMMDIKW